MIIDRCLCGEKPAQQCFSPDCIWQRGADWAAVHGLLRDLFEECLRAPDSTSRQELAGALVIYEQAAAVWHASLSPSELDFLAKLGDGTVTNADHIPQWGWKMLPPDFQMFHAADERAFA